MGIEDMAFDMNVHFCFALRWKRRQTGSQWTGPLL